MPNPENIEKYKMKKGETLNPHGRPRKYVSLLKEQGYKISEINDTIQAMMAMDIDELKAVFENSKATILERTIANAMKKSLDKGSLYSLETLLTRVFGKPKETAEIKSETQITGSLEINIRSSNLPLSNKESDIETNRHS
jgi:hypothetical protein